MLEVILPAVHWHVCSSFHRVGDIVSVTKIPKTSKSVSDGNHFSHLAASCLVSQSVSQSFTGSRVSPHSLLFAPLLLLKWFIAEQLAASTPLVFMFPVETKSKCCYLSAGKNSSSNPCAKNLTRYHLQSLEIKGWSCIYELYIVRHVACQGLFMYVSNGDPLGWRRHAPQRTQSFAAFTDWRLIP